jgi:hypothetical protein
MDELILKAASEIGLGSHVSVAPFDGLDLLVTVSVPTRAVQTRIPVRYLTESSLDQVKTILRDMARYVGVN